METFDYQKKTKNLVWMIPKATSLITDGINPVAFFWFQWQELENKLTDELYPISLENAEQSVFKSKTQQKSN